MTKKYYVILKENHHISSMDVIDKIKKIELLTPEERFPFKNELTEVYESGSKNKCQEFICSLSQDIQDLFEIIDRDIETEDE